MDPLQGESFQPVKGLEIVGHASGVFRDPCGVAHTQDHVSGEEGSALQPMEGQVVSGVPRCVDRLQVPNVGGDAIPVGKGSCSRMPRAYDGRLGKRYHQGVDRAGMVVVSVGENHGHLFGRVYRTHDGPDVITQVRAGIDDGHVSVTQDVRPGPLVREGTRVVRQERTEGVHPTSDSAALSRQLLGELVRDHGQGRLVLLSEGGLLGAVQVELPEDLLPGADQDHHL